VLPVVVLASPAHLSVDDLFVQAEAGRPKPGMWRFSNLHARRPHAEPRTTARKALTVPLEPALRACMLKYQQPIDTRMDV
jgi:hypothetical protein